MRLQKLGGYVSIGLACFLILKPGIELIMYARLGLTGWGDAMDPVKMIAAHATSPTAFEALFNSLFWLGSLFGICFLILVKTLEERIREKAPHLMHLALIFASICCAFAIAYNLTRISYGIFLSSKDISAFRAYLTMANSIGLVSDFALGCSFLLIGSAALRTKALPRMLCFTLLANGIAQITLNGFIGLWIAIINYAWLAIILLRKEQPDLEVAAAVYNRVG
jgi:lysylphosphatidylglycerol synthetase-like protein (DUF2156 family)